MRGNPMTLCDLLDLALLRLAKRRRAHMAAQDAREAFYEDFFTDLDERVLASGEDPRKKARLDSVREGVVRHSCPGKLLDVGCGCGDNLAHLKDLDGYRLHGVEYASATAARARRVLANQAEILEGSALDLPYPSASMGTITCVEVLEHVADDRKALQEIHRVLEPGGVLVLTVPYRHWFPAYRELMGHERHYTRQGLEELLRASGFIILEHLPNYPRWHRAADYAFAVCRFMGLVAGRLGGEGDPHRVRLPLMRRPLLQVLHGMLGWLRRRDVRLDYAHRGTSTSVVARKPALTEGEE